MVRSGMIAVESGLLFVKIAAIGLQLAYIDPNAGGMLFQALAAGFALVSGIALVFSRQIRAASARLRRRARRRSGRSDELLQDVLAEQERAEGLGDE